MDRLFEEEFKHIPDDDLLDDDSDLLPKNQKVFVMAFVEPNPIIHDLRAAFEFEEFIKYTEISANSRKMKEQLSSEITEIESEGENEDEKESEDEANSPMGDEAISIIRLYFEKKHDIGFLLRYFQQFKKINRKKLDLAFSKKYKNYGGFRMMKFLGAYRTQDRADQKIREFGDRHGGYNVFKFEPGFWVLYNPADYVDRPEYMEKKMQQLMQHDIENKLRSTADFTKRRHVLISKEILDRKGELDAFSMDIKQSDGSHVRDGSIRESGILSEEEIENEYDKYNPKLEYDLIIPMGDEEQRKFTDPAYQMIKKEIDTHSTYINPEMLNQLGFSEEYKSKNEENKIIFEKRLAAPEDPI